MQCTLWILATVLPLEVILTGTWGGKLYQELTGGHAKHIIHEYCWKAALDGIHCLSGENILKVSNLDSKVELFGLKVWDEFWI